MFLCCAIRQLHVNKRQKKKCIQSMASASTVITLKTLRERTIEASKGKTTKPKKKEIYARSLTPFCTHDASASSSRIGHFLSRAGNLTRSRACLFVLHLVFWDKTQPRNLVWDSIFCTQPPKIFYKSLSSRFEVLHTYVPGISYQGLRKMRCRPRR